MARRTHAVDQVRANEMLAKTFATIDWIEGRLPPELRRPRYELVNHVFKSDRLLRLSIQCQ